MLFDSQSIDRIMKSRWCLWARWGPDESVHTTDGSFPSNRSAWRMKDSYWILISLKQLGHPRVNMKIWMSWPGRDWSHRILLACSCADGGNLLQQKLCHLSSFTHFGHFYCSNNVISSLRLLLPIYTVHFSKVEKSYENMILHHLIMNIIYRF